MIVVDKLWMTVWTLDLILSHSYDEWISFLYFVVRSFEMNSCNDHEIGNGPSSSSSVLIQETDKLCM